MSFTDFSLKILRSPPDSVEERWLDKPGHVLVLSSLSGSIRALYGLAKMVSYVCLCVFYTMGFACCRNGKEHTFCEQGVKDSLKGASEGFCSIIRGVIETVPVIGNKIVIVADGKKEAPQRDSL